jgi:hypothetical protein
VSPRGFFWSAVCLLGLVVWFYGPLEMLQLGWQVLGDVAMWTSEELGKLL